MIKTYIQIAPDGTRTEVTYDTKAQPFPAAVDRTDYERYSKLKKQIRAGIYISREDFMYVKAIDHRSNVRTAMRMSGQIKKSVPGTAPVFTGFNTAPR